MLPFIGRTDLYEQYQFDKPFYAPQNEPIVRLPMADFQCPAAPEPNRLIKMGMGNEEFGTQGVAGDYFVNHFLNAMGFPDGRRTSAGAIGRRPISADEQDYRRHLVHDAHPRTSGPARPLILRDKQPDASKHTLANWWGPWTRG